MFCFLSLQVVTLPLLPPEYRKLYSEVLPRAGALSCGPPAALVVAVDTYPPRGQPYHHGEDFFRPTLTTGASRPDQGRSGISHRRAHNTQSSTKEDELLKTIQQLNETIRGLREELAAAKRGGGMQSQQQQSSPGSTTRKATYAEGLASRKASIKSTVAVQALPTQGAPVQPVASAVSKMLRKHKCTSVFPLENYSEEERKTEHIKQVKARRKVTDWPTKDAADFKHVLLVGHSVHEAHAIDTQALGSHECSHSMSAALLATGATRQDASVSHVLSSLGRSQDSLSIAGCSMHSTVVTERMQWTTAEKVEHIYPKGHLLLVQWSRDTLDSEEVKDSEPALLPRDNTAVRVVCSLNPQSLREGDNSTNKVKTQKWAKEVCWETTAPLLKPPLTTPPPPPWSWGNAGNGSKSPWHYRIRWCSKCSNKAVHGRASSTGCS